MSTRELLFQWADTIKIQLSVFLFFKADIIIISSIVTCFRNDLDENNCSFGAKPQSITNKTG